MLGFWASGWDGKPHQGKDMIRVNMRNIIR